MTNLTSRTSTSCLYNMKEDHTATLGGHEGISPISVMSENLPPPIQHFYNDEKVSCDSPAEKQSALFSDEKIALPMAEPVVHVSAVRAAEYGTGAGVGAGVNLEYVPTTDPESVKEVARRDPRPPVWKRHILWMIGLAGLMLIIIGFVAWVISHHATGSKKALKIGGPIPNNTLNSVASTGLFLRDNSTWNMHVLSQNSSGDITLQVSLDGKTYQPPRKVSLRIPAKKGSPLSATSEQDSTTGVVMINLFYVSGTNNITMSAITCAEGSSKCNTINNCLLPTDKPANNNTGLAAVNVDDAQDWRVFYHDQTGLISQLAGNASGFDNGLAIGGVGLNNSSIAAVNVNSTTNNIQVFFVDNFSSDLFTMQFTKGAWTVPRAITTDTVNEWNPNSGLGASYSPGNDQLHVYYTGSDANIYEFFGENVHSTNTSWWDQPKHSDLWATADYAGADITSVGWKDQVRFWQVAQGSLVQGVMSNTTWTESFVTSS